MHSVVRSGGESTPADKGDDFNDIAGGKILLLMVIPGNKAPVDLDGTGAARKTQPGQQFSNLRRLLQMHRFAVDGDVHPVILAGC